MFRACSPHDRLDEAHSQLSELFQPILDDLFCVADTCNAYVLKRGASAIAIDIGSGRWIPSLHEIGVKRLEWVLLTHTHRDQCSGLYDLDRETCRVAVPQHERHLVDGVERFWGRRRTFHNYNQVGDFLSLPRSVPVDEVLADFDPFRWRDIDLEILPAPGHTPGSIALLTTLHGRRVALTGDMIAAPGAVPRIHDLQFGYADAAGAELLARSLHLLLDRNPELLCPGRGPIIEPPEPAVGKLLTALEALGRELFHEGSLSPDVSFIQVSGHLLESKSASCSWYAVLSEDRHALLIDLGYDTGTEGNVHAFDYRSRFLPHRLEALRRHPAVDTIDAILVTHYHDDHVIGIPYAQKRWDLPVWCLDRIAPILQEPHRFNMPCLLPTPLRVARTFTDREQFTWRSVDFQMHDLPGQTDLHSGISFDLDGQRYLAMGDSAHFRDGRLSHGHIIFANRVTGENHRKVAARMLEIEPTVLLHGHHRRQVDEGGRIEGRADTPVTRDDLVEFAASSDRLADALRDVVPDEPDWRCRADWVRIDPYRVPVGAEAVPVTLIAENLLDRPIHLALRFVAPEGVEVDPPIAEMLIEPGAEHACDHLVSVLDPTACSPAILCVDVVMDGRPLGWLAEAQLWHRGDWPS
ncbi:MAG: hypothetical protein CMJ18_09830 [Phycisphaeraceae bacterium]|nr:hypothetical protein [Phycisphaeraceae bacterium]